MKLHIAALLTVLLCLTATSALAIDSEASVNLGIYDKYLWRGIDLSDSTAVAQGSVEITTGGFTMGLWGNAQFADDAGYDAGEINEIDLTLDYSFDAFDLLTVNFGNITYFLEDLDDTNEAYLGLSVNTLLTPTVTAYYDWDEADGNGLFYTAAVSHSFTPCDHAAINLGALVSYNDKSDYAISYYDRKSNENKSFSHWHNYELSASADIELGEQWTITPSLLYSSPLSNEAQRAIDSEWLAGVNVTFSTGL